MQGLHDQPLVQGLKTQGFQGGELFFAAHFLERPTHPFGRDLGRLCNEHSSTWSVGALRVNLEGIVLPLALEWAHFILHSFGPF